MFANEYKSIETIALLNIIIISLIKISPEAKEIKSVRFKLLLRTKENEKKNIV